MHDLLTCLLAESCVPPSHDELIEAFHAQFDDSAEMLNLFSLRTGQVLAQNPAACSQIGYHDDDLREKSIGDFHPDDQRATAEAAFRQLIRFGFSETEVTMYLKSGALARLRLRSFLIVRDPEPICLTHTLRIEALE